MDNYRVVSNLGSGTFGSVQKAIHRTTREVVAIKKLKRKYHSLDECIRLRELQSLISLSSHSNIVTLKHFIFENDEFFFVFEHMNNDLHRLIKYKDRDKPFSEAEVRKWMVQLLEAVEFMHKQGYIHRDLKPENLLISNDHAIKVADLGLARDMKSGLPCTSGVGTRWYMAPEVLLQSSMKSSSYGAAVDMWAVGAIMAELFYLCPLFRGKSALDQIYQICVVLGAPTQETWADGVQMAASLGFQFPQLHSPWPLSDYLPKASLEAVDLIRAMCSWDPSKRPTASQALQHPFFQNHKQQPARLLLPRQGCHSKLQSTRAAVMKREVQPMGKAKFGHQLGLRYISLQQGALVV